MPPNFLRLEVMIQTNNYKSDFHFLSNWMKIFCQQPEVWNPDTSRCWVSSLVRPLLQQSLLLESLSLVCRWNAAQWNSGDWLLYFTELRWFGSMFSIFVHLHCEVFGWMWASIQLPFLDRLVNMKGDRGSTLNSLTTQWNTNFVIRTPHHDIPTKKAKEQKHTNVQACGYPNWTCVKTLGLITVTLKKRTSLTFFVCFYSTSMALHIFPR